MRALGPGSVSSFLKIILDVVYVAFWIAAIGGVLVTVGAVFYDLAPGLFNIHITGRTELTAGKTELALTPALFTAAAAAFTAYAAVVLVIVDRLRRIFATLTAGDPFHPENVRRLRTVGVMLAVLELGRYPVAAVDTWLSPHPDAVSLSPSPTAWFAVLVVFVLAEVFREGARLRREAELTI